MTREDEIRRIKIDVAAIVTTLAEEPGQWSPKTAIYLALGANMGRFNQVLDVLRTSGLVTHDHDTVTLTRAGIDLANKITQAIG